MVSARFHRDSIKFGKWTLSRWGLPVNVFALIYTAYVGFFLCFPTMLPVTGENMNYALPILSFVVLLALIWWFVWGRRNWSGPNVQIIALVVEEGKLVLNQGKKGIE